MTFFFNLFFFLFVYWNHSYPSAYTFGTDDSKSLLTVFTASIPCWLTFLTLTVYIAKCNTHRGKCTEKMWTLIYHKEKTHVTNTQV